MADDLDGEMSAEEEKWRVESDVRTLTEAMEIRKDRTRFRAAMKAARTMMDNLNSLENDGDAR